MVGGLAVLLLPGLLLLAALLTLVTEHDDGSARADGQATEVLVLTQRYGEAVHFFDPRTLETSGRIELGRSVERVTIVPEDGRLFLSVGQADRAGCCELWTLELATLEACPIAFPVLGSTAAPDGSVVYFVRGSVGVERLETGSLRRRPALQGPGTYNVYPSPDGAWLFGVTYFRGPSVDVFDLESGELVTRHFVGEQGSETMPQFGGAWVRNNFLIYVHDGRSAYLHQLSPTDEPLDHLRLTALTVQAGDVPAHELPREWNIEVLAAGDRLLVYQQLGDWFKGNPRRKGWAHLIDGPVHGGIFVIDVEAGAVTSHLAAKIDFAFVAADETGDHLFGVVAQDDETGEPVRLLQLDGRTGKVLSERTLEADIWRPEHALLPAGLIPRGTMEAGTCYSQYGAPDRRPVTDR